MSSNIVLVLSATPLNNDKLKLSSVLPNIVLNQITLVSMYKPHFFLAKLNSSFLTPIFILLFFFFCSLLFNLSVDFIKLVIPMADLRVLLSRKTQALDNVPCTSHSHTCSSRVTIAIYIYSYIVFTLYIGKKSWYCSLKLLGKQYTFSSLFLCLFLHDASVNVIPVVLVKLMSTSMPPVMLMVIPTVAW